MYNPLMSSTRTISRIAQRLRDIPIFDALDSAVMIEMAAAAQWHEYQAGEIIVLEGEAQRGLYYLEHGYVKIIITSIAGREQTLRVLEPGDTFNEIGVFTQQPSPATAVALEPVGIWLIQRDALNLLLEKHPAFCRSVMERMAERLMSLVSLVTDLSLRPVTGRLARLLLDNSSDDIVARPRWSTQAEIAARLGTVPDVVQRSLRGLEAEGLIIVERQHIRILNRQELERLAG